MSKCVFGRVGGRVYDFCVSLLDRRSLNGAVWLHLKRNLKEIGLLLLHTFLPFAFSCRLDKQLRTEEAYQRFVIRGVTGPGNLLKFAKNPPGKREVQTAC